MTHSPPIPPGNQSPYPIVEPPHAHPAPVHAPPVGIAVSDDPIAPAIAIGAIALAAVAGLAALFYARRGTTPAPAAKRPARKNAATPAPRKGATGRQPATLKSSPAKAPAKRKRGPQDASRIAMSEDYEVRYWTRKFGVDRATLQRAVDAVGHGAAAVEQELRRS